MNRFLTVFIAYIIYFLSGWRLIEVFGLPKMPKGKNFVNVLVSSGDGTIIDICQQYVNAKGEIKWQQGGLSSDIYPEHREVKYWKSISYSQYTSKMIAKMIEGDK